jgi:large subunit ribosomal protein L1
MNDFLNALQELRKISIKRNFDQTVDLIINLKDFDVKRDSVNIFVLLPNIFKKKRICAFFENPNIIPTYTITKKEIGRLDGKSIKEFAKDYDLFIASAKLMPTIASKFGRVLGPMGKMPDPKVGAVLINENEEAISAVVKRLSRSIKIKTKEASIKVAVGKEGMKDEQIIENAQLVYSKVVEALPRKKENVKSIMFKFTMSKPVKIKQGENKS